LPELLEVRFKGNRKAFFTWDNTEPLALGDPVVVEVERGMDFGHVSAVGEAAAKKCGAGCNGCALTQPKDPTGKVLRVASSDDKSVSTELRRAEEDVRQKVMDRIRTHNLPMKASDAEWQWDRKKLTIYFTAETRVDFRNLVRDLATLFRTRIELRQIGARDEAKRLDGVGRCGRQYCCSSWLPELRPVSLSLAKDQRLSLNPSQISGGCGRLLCCLRYEHEFYVTSRKRFPKEGKEIRTGKGAEKVISVDIFRERVLLRSEDGTTRTLMLSDLRQETQAVGFVFTQPEKEPKAPAALATFDEGDAPITPEAAVDAVSPRPKGNRRRRRGRRRNRRSGGSGQPPGSSSPQDPPPSGNPGGE
jgi:cell fate regulator YaaT (PSP1 superfamily)